MMQKQPDFTTGHVFLTLGLGGTRGAMPKREKSRYHAGLPDVPSGVSGVELEKVPGSEA
jgi:hypothetical protein